MLVERMERISKDSTLPWQNAVIYIRFVEELQQFVEVGQAEVYPCTHMHMHCALSPRANPDQSAQHLDDNRLTGPR
jgi:hypothetical protein